MFIFAEFVALRHDKRDSIERLHVEESVVRGALDPALRLQLGWTEQLAADDRDALAKRVPAVANY